MTRRDGEDLVAWAASLIEREAVAGTYGTITIHLEAGTITRARIERSEMPQRENAGKNQKV